LNRAASACSFALLAACSSLPTIAPGNAEAAGTTAVRIDGPHGPLSADAQKRVLDRLKAAGQDTDIFERHLAFEQEIVGSPLSAGNKVTLLQDGPSTYQALYAAMAGA
jgi:cardiolipin synthase